MMSNLLNTIIKNRLTIALLSILFFSVSFILTNVEASELNNPKLSIVSQKYLAQNKRSISSVKKIKKENLEKFEINNSELVELSGFKVMKRVHYKKLNISLAKLN